MSIAFNTPAGPPVGATLSEARAVLAESVPGRVVLSFPGTDYQIHLIPERPPTSAVGKRVTGVIRAQSRRIDRVASGGRFIEPVMGRPRIVQGRVVEVNPSATGTGTLTIHAPMPIVVRVGELQKAEQFKVGDLVTTHTVPGATFTPTS